MRALRSGALGIFINPSKGLTQIQGVMRALRTGDAPGEEAHRPLAPEAVQRRGHYPTTPHMLRQNDLEDGRLTTSCRASSGSRLPQLANILTIKRNDLGPRMCWAWAR